MNKEYRLAPQFCIHNGSVIIEQNEDQVTVGIKNFNDEDLKRKINRSVEENTGKITLFVEIDEEEFLRHISSVFSKNENEGCSEQEAERTSYDDNAARALFESFIRKALDSGATDIHLENDLVRFRICGCLSQPVYVDEKSMGYVVQHIKILSRLNLLEHRNGQDGQFIYEGNGKRIFIRVSLIPVLTRSGKLTGESMVLRILDTQRVALDLDDLGFEQKQFDVLEKFCMQKNGLIIISGPTGSGKSTTACSMLKKINSLSQGKRKLISLEDPPEYILENVTQVHMEGQSDLDFKEGLKRIFRHDPDVIMIGEIRDRESAEVAFEAALTGHLVIATMHSGSFEQVLIRLSNFGIQENFVREVLRGVILQDLEMGCLKACIKDLRREVLEMEYAE